jgi:hypothetical protein
MTDADTSYEDIHTSPDHSAYANVTPVNGLDEILPDNYISPYAEDGLGKRMSAFIKRALPKIPSMRKVPASGEKEPGQMKYSKRINHKNTKNAKPAVPTKPKGNKEDADIEMTSGEKSVNGKKVVNHKTSEEGNLYALPDIDGKLMDGTSNRIEHLVTDQGDMYALPMKKS